MNRASNDRAGRYNRDPGEVLGLHAAGRVQLLLVLRSPPWSCDTLEGYLGEQTMARLMRTYHERWRFKHPRSEDFFALVNEVTGQDWSWYFDQVVRGTDIVDYDIGSASTRSRPERAQGVFDDAGGPQDGVAQPTPTRRTARSSGRRSRSSSRSWSCGGAAAWRCRSRWPSSSKASPSSGRRGTAATRRRRSGSSGPRSSSGSDVDPDRKIALDVNWVNNGRRIDARPPRRRPAGRPDGCSCFRTSSPRWDCCSARPMEAVDMTASIRDGLRLAAAGTRSSCACSGRGTGCWRSCLRFRRGAGGTACSAPRPKRRRC